MASAGLENVLDEILGEQGTIGLKSFGDTAGIENGKFSYSSYDGSGIKSDGMFGDAFSSENIGGTMQGIGVVAGSAAEIYDAYNKKKYQDKVFGMEEKRVARETDRQDRQQASYDRVFG